MDIITSKETPPYFVVLRPHNQYNIRHFLTDNINIDEYDTEKINDYIKVQRKVPKNAPIYLPLGHAVRPKELILVSSLLCKQASDFQQIEPGLWQPVIPDKTYQSVGLLYSIDKPSSKIGLVPKKCLIITETKNKKLIEPYNILTNQKNGFWTIDLNNHNNLNSLFGNLKGSLVKLVVSDNPWYRQFSIPVDNMSDSSSDYSETSEQPTISTEIVDIVDIQENKKNKKYNMCINFLIIVTAICLIYLWYHYRAKKNLSG